MRNGSLGFSRTGIALFRVLLMTRIVLVTGAASGIGEAIAKALRASSGTSSGVDRNTTGAAVLRRLWPMLVHLAMNCRSKPLPRRLTTR